MRGLALALLLTMFSAGCFSFSSGPETAGGTPGIVPGMTGGLFGGTPCADCQGRYGERGATPATLASVQDAWGGNYPIQAPWGKPGNPGIERSLVSNPLPPGMFQFNTQDSLASAQGMGPNGMRMPMPAVPGGILSQPGVPPMPGMSAMPGGVMQAGYNRPMPPQAGGYPLSNYPPNNNYPPAIGNYPLTNAYFNGAVPSVARNSPADNGIRQAQYTQPQGGAPYGPPNGMQYNSSGGFGAFGGNPYSPPGGMPYGPPAGPYGMPYGPPGSMPCPPNNINPYQCGPNGMPCLPGSYAPIGGTQIGDRRIQIRFNRPVGMKVSWFAMGPDGRPMYSDFPIITPGPYNFIQGAIYRLKLTNIDEHPELSVYPTMELMAVNSKSEPFLSHNAIPLDFTSEDFKQIVEGNYVVKVIYLPDPQFQDLAGTGTDEILSTRLEPGVDPIQEARRRGTVLLVIRMGNLQQELPYAPGLNAPSMTRGFSSPPSTSGNPMSPCPPPGYPGSAWVPGPNGFNLNNNCAPNYPGSYGGRGAPPLEQVPMYGTWGANAGPSCNTPNYPPQMGGPNMTYPGAGAGAGGVGGNTYRGSSVTPPWQGGSWLGTQGNTNLPNGNQVPPINPVYPPGNAPYTPSTEPPDPRGSSVTPPHPLSFPALGASPAPTRNTPTPDSRNDQTAVLRLPEQLPATNAAPAADRYAPPPASSFELPPNLATTPAANAPNSAAGSPSTPTTPANVQALPPSLPVTPPTPEYAPNPAAGSPGTPTVPGNVEALPPSLPSTPPSPEYAPNPAAGSPSAPTAPGNVQALPPSLPPSPEYAPNPAGGSPGTPTAPGNVQALPPSLPSPEYTPNAGTTLPSTSTTPAPTPPGVPLPITPTGPTPGSPPIPEGPISSTPGSDFSRTALFDGAKGGEASIPAPATANVMNNATQPANGHPSSSPSANTPPRTEPIEEDAPLMPDMPGIQGSAADSAFIPPPETSPPPIALPK